VKVWEGKKRRRRGKEQGRVQLKVKFHLRCERCSRGSCGQMLSSDETQ
jgi:hypothetical protein